MNGMTARKATLAITALVAFAALLAIFVFSQQSLRLDESQSLWQTSRTPGKILNILAQDVHVPLYHMILHYWQLFLGNGVFAARALSLVFFLAAIPAMYALGSLAFSRRIGVFGATLLAVSPFMNWYGSEIRMYSLLTLVTIASQYFFARIFLKQDRQAWVGYLLVALAGIFVHYFFWFVLLVQGIFYLIYRDMFPAGSFRRLATIAVALVVAFAPWIWYVQHLGTVSNEAPLLTPPSSVNVFNTMSQFLFGFQNDHLNTILVSLWPLTVLLGFLALRDSKRVPPAAIYFMLSILVPIAAAFAVSVTLRPLFVSRYLILTIPSLYLFIGWMFSTYPLSLRRGFESAIVVAMIAGLAIEVVSPTSPVKEDYRDAASYLEANAAPQDVIVLSAPFTVYPIEYYYKGPAEIETLPVWNRFVTGPIPAWNDSKLPADVDAIKGFHDKAWVLLSYDQGYEEKIRLYFDKNFKRIDERHFSPGLTLYAYQLRYDPPILEISSTSRR